MLSIDYLQKSPPCKRNFSKTPTVIGGEIKRCMEWRRKNNVQAQLPADFAKLFDVQNAGSLPAVDELPESVE
jgi:hypothetical protein